MGLVCRLFQVDALYWRRAMVLLLEEVLAVEKERLFDGTRGPADYDLISTYTALIGRLRKSGRRTARRLRNQ